MNEVEIIMDFFHKKPLRSNAKISRVWVVLAKIENSIFVYRDTRLAPRFLLFYSNKRRWTSPTTDKGSRRNLDTDVSGLEKKEQHR